jgi:hypothetical protein
MRIYFLGFIGDGVHGFPGALNSTATVSLGDELALKLAPRRLLFSCIHKPGRIVLPDDGLSCFILLPSPGTRPTDE